MDFKILHQLPTQEKTLEHSFWISGKSDWFYKGLSVRIFSYENTATYSHHDTESEI